MSMIDDIKRDAETGTPGPWSTDTSDQGGAGSNAYVGIDNGAQCIARVVCYSPLTLHDRPYKENARRIARVPEMEAALIAADELAKAYGLYRERPAMDNPDDWRRMDEALDAYRAVTGGDT